MNNSYTKFFKEMKTVSYPAEAVIRIFKGKYPKLELKYKKKNKILDLGFGDGRHLFFFKSLGLDVYGIDIDKSIIENKKLKNKNFKLKVGSANQLPFKNNFFDIIIAWNSCYYMGKSRYNLNFCNTVKEISKKLKKNGYLICSVPTKKCFIFSDSKIVKKNYRLITNDYFGQLRNGEIMRCFDSFSDIQKEFGTAFKNFSFSKISIDCFGLPYEWFVFVAQKK